MNWGKGITIVIILFIGWIAFLIYKTGEVTSEMVTDNYYEKELVYEKVIQAKRNVQQLSALPTISQQQNNVLITFPEEVTTAATGNIVFYRPNNPQQDKKYTITINNNNAQNIATSDLTKGVYQIQLTWQQNNIPYYYEKNIFIE
jgi:hypothetical protein